MHTQEGKERKIETEKLKTIKNKKTITIELNKQHIDLH